MHAGIARLLRRTADRIDPPNRVKLAPSVVEIGGTTVYLQPSPPPPEIGRMLLDEVRRSQDVSRLGRPW